MIRGQPVSESDIEVEKKGQFTSVAVYHKMPLYDM